jgi:threonine dehydrogenase-like Zn-dependent dehydrogenase
MQALVTTPGTAHSTRIEDVGEPRVREGEVLVRVLEVGVCGTDREIDHGLFGVAPEGERELVVGHELLGVVERDGAGYARGQLVAATVRRSCGHCVACAESSPDACLTGDYSERGITRLHGFARELVAESAVELVPIPETLGRSGVLAEPMSIASRALRHAVAIGGRQPWQLQRALVIGAGAIGLLTTCLLRLRGVEVWTVSLEPGNDVVDALGARYATAVDDLGSFDLVVEAAGSAQLMAGSLGLLRRGGVACVLGIDGRAQRVEVDGHVLGVELVLGNRVLFGSVNAHRQDWLSGVEALASVQERWPGVLEELVTLRVPLDRFDEAFAEHGGKATLVLA